MKWKGLMDNLYKSKKKGTDGPVDAPVASPSYPAGEPHFPDHFSLLSAQHGPSHNEEAHKKLYNQINEKGFKITEISGNWGYPEQSYMVEHDGKPSSLKTLEDIAFKNHSQEAIIHSSLGNNKLKYKDGKMSEGFGHAHGSNFTDYYSVLPSGHKIRLNVTKDDVSKSEEKELKKPHCYGKYDGVWVFHATHPSHNDSLIGDKYENLDNEGFKKALSDAKKRKTRAIVLIGTPPSSLLNSIHPKLGPIDGGKIAKSNLIKKENKNLDGQIVISDVGSRLKELKSKIDKNIKSSDLKNKKINMSAEDFIKKHDKLINVLQSPSHEDDKVEADRQAIELDQKLKQLENKKNKPEVMNYKEIAQGLSNPEKECDACGSDQPFCDCYAGLPVPKIEFDFNTKKMTVLFKNDWDFESRAAFLEDLKMRASVIIKSKYVTKKKI